MVAGDYNADGSYFDEEHNMECRGGRHSKDQGNVPKALQF
jgi:hypothetical protein